MAAELAHDVLEQILIGLDVKDIIRCKSVCKSWYSFTTSPCFVKAHLKRYHDNDRNDPELGGHRRIVGLSVVNIEYWLCKNRIHVVGSCNGLVCISPINAEFVVSNPTTREQKQLQNPPFKLEIGMIRQVVCWGFGYDSSADDYKVVVGFRESVDKKRTLFYVLTLKSNVWKIIGEVNYRCYADGVDGILYGGALHWFMSDANKRVIISLDLSTEEFKEIPQPAYKEYKRHDGHGCAEDHECDQYALGILQECLCIYSWVLPFSRKKWIMKNNKWEPYNDYCCGDTYDVAHYVKVSENTVYTYDDGGRVHSDGHHICASIFVKSLVSPHPRRYPHISNDDNDYEGQYRRSMVQEAKESVESGVVRKKEKRRKGSFKHMMTRKVSMMKKRSSCKHKKPLIWV